MEKEPEQPKNWLDPLEGYSTENSPSVGFRESSMPPPDGGAWIRGLFNRNKAKRLAEEARTGKPTPLPKVW